MTIVVKYPLQIWRTSVSSRPWRTVKLVMGVNTEMAVLSWLEAREPAVMMELLTRLMKVAW